MRIIINYINKRFCGEFKGEKNACKQSRKKEIQKKEKTCIITQFCTVANNTLFIVF